MVCSNKENSPPKWEGCIFFGLEIPNLPARVVIVDSTVAPAGNRGRANFSNTIGLVAIGCVVVVGLYSYRGNHEPEPGLATYLRGAISCCTAHQLEPFANPESPAILSQILANPIDEPYWPNAVLALGILAPYSDDLAARLLDFVDTPNVFPAAAGKPVKLVFQAEISEGLVTAKMHALVACGNLLSRAPGKTDSPALDTLINGTDPAFWQGRIQWRSTPHFADDEERNTTLAGEAVKALAASHLPAAKQRLVYLRDTLRPQQALLRESLDRALCDAGLSPCLSAAQ
jgi:hypothetical protein